MATMHVLDVESQTMPHQNGDSKMLTVTLKTRRATFSGIRSYILLGSYILQGGNSVVVRLQPSSSLGACSLGNSWISHCVRFILDRAIWARVFKSCYNKSYGSWYRSCHDKQSWCNQNLMEVISLFQDPCIWYKLNLKKTYTDKPMLNCWLTKYRIYM